MLAHTHVKIHERDKCQVDAMLVLVNLDMFAQFLAAWNPTSCQRVLIQKFHVSYGG